jgi:hypothetical protein
MKPLLPKNKNNHRISRATANSRMRMMNTDMSFKEFERSRPHSSIDRNSK